MPKRKNVHPLTAEAEETTHVLHVFTYISKKGVTYRPLAQSTEIKPPDLKCEAS